MHFDARSLGSHLIIIDQLNGSGTFCASVQTPDRKWYSYDCSVTKPYVCEIPIVVQPTCPPIPTEIEPTNCPPIPTEAAQTTCPPIESCATAEPQFQSPCPTGDDWVYLKLFNKCYLVWVKVEKIRKKSNVL